MQMKFLKRVILVLLVMSLLPLGVFAQDTSEKGAFYTGEYPNALLEWGISKEDIQARIDATWEQLFYGNDETQRVYYPVGDDMAYILDTGNDDIRSEGMSYGMMIAVQLDKQEEFDRIWKWTKTYMYQSEGPYRGYFAWHARPDGSQIDANPAPDGEEWFVMALFFAAARWGNGEGIFDYEAQANEILYAMLHKDDEGGIATNMFHKDWHMVVFVPRLGVNNGFTDPSYHLPHFYELWARWAAEDNDYWTEAAQVSRDFWKITVHPETGLMPNYAEFTGEPHPSGDYGEFFYADAWRTGMNIAMDYVWFEPDEWHIEQSNRMLQFFYDQGVTKYSDKFPIDGSEALTPWHSEGLVATNAVVAMISDQPFRDEFFADFWNTPLPTGTYRYYSGLLYMFALLNLSGNFRIYSPS